MKKNQVNALYLNKKKLYCLRTGGPRMKKSALYLNKKRVTV